MEKILGCLACGEPKSLEHIEAFEGISEAVQRFTYRELKNATNKFRDLIGKGGSANVYYGKLSDATEVAVKKLHSHNPKDRQMEFDAEVLTLSRVDHPNIVKLIGYCFESNRRLVVYELLPLIQNLEIHRGYNWSTKMRIAADVAVALEYLHDKITPPVIYSDLKCANIMLVSGPEEKEYAKLTDFGLAKTGPAYYFGASADHFIGTPGNFDPAILASRSLTLKSDIYCFGVVLLELITEQFGVSSTFGNRNVLLADWATAMYRDRSSFLKMVVPKFHDQCSRSGLRKALSMAVSCVQQNAGNRPCAADMVPVLKDLSEEERIGPVMSRSVHRRILSLPPEILKDHRNNQPPETVRRAKHRRIWSLPPALL